MKQIKIVREISIKDFEIKINRLLSKGWKIKNNIYVDKESFLYQMLEKKQ